MVDSSPIHIHLSATASNKWTASVDKYSQQLASFSESEAT